MRRSLVTLTLLVVGGVAVYVTWRLSYYGDWLPNTARGRAGLSAMRLERGLYYVVSQAFTVPSVVLLLLLAPLSPSRRQLSLRLPVGPCRPGTFPRERSRPDNRWSGVSVLG